MLNKGSYRSPVHDKLKAECAPHETMKRSKTEVDKVVIKHAFFKKKNLVCL